jgi:hypothetical protein
MATLAAIDNVVLIAVAIALVVGVIIGFYTYRGSGINPHAGSKAGDAAPGASGPSAEGGKGRMPDVAPDDDAEADPLDSPGTR